MGAFTLNSTANALAIMLAGGNTNIHGQDEVSTEIATGKRTTVTHHHISQTVTPERKAMNAMVHARNLSSQ